MYEFCWKTKRKMVPSSSAVTFCSCSLSFHIICTFKLLKSYCFLCKTVSCLYRAHVGLQS